MIKLQDYFQDGACAAAQMTMIALSERGEISQSWNEQSGQYEATIMIARWENGREQGYICSLRSKDYIRQLNIAFFEHRNSDMICAVRWEQVSMNSLTIDSAQFGDVYANKYDVSKAVRYNGAYELAEWIFNEFADFWVETSIELI